MSKKDRERAMKAAAVAIAAQILEQATSPLLLTYDDVEGRFGLDAKEGICAPLANAIEAALEEDTGESWKYRVVVSFFALTLEGRHTDTNNGPTGLLHVVLLTKNPVKKPTLEHAAA